MPANEDNNLATQVGELRADVRHVQSDVTDIKAELRINNQRIESLRKETSERFDKVDQRFEKVDQKIETLRTETLARFDKVDQKFEKVDQKFEAVRKETAEVKDSLASAKIWALWLYVGLAGSLFYVLARGFRWL